jgi:putative oxidoreductase
MKIVSTISRYLLGLIFTVFGLNGFLNFIPPQAVPPLALQFVGALIQSHFMTFIFAIELASGVLLLANRFVPLALTILAPVIVNILLFHGLMAPSGMPLALVVALLWAVLAYRFRYSFAPLFEHSATEPSAGPDLHPGRATVNA